ncbi:MAG TPA: DUF4349 domain-containing protein [Flavisolibacter sp.]|jgi:hypothetical protein
MKNSIAMFSGILLAVLISCGHADNQNQVSSTKTMEIEKEQYEAATDSSTGNGGTQQSPTPDAPPSTVNWDKKIVKTATLNAEVKDYKTFSTSLYEKVKRFGGYVSNERQNQTEYKIENSMTIRLPVDRFDEAMNELLAGATAINEKTVSSEDLTGEFVDGRSRLEAKKQVRLRYLDLLKQAKNMAEILEVQQEINGIQEEIETVNGRLNFINHSSAMSTIHFTFYQVLNPALASNQTNDNSFFARLTDAFSNGWQWLASLFIGLISLWPLALIAIPVVYIVKKRWKEKKAVG